MRAVVQRVMNASVIVDDKTVGEISNGLLLFLGVCEEDEDKDLEYIYNKVIGLRIFTDENDLMNLSLKDVDGELLIVSQFTLYGDVRKGKRPSFTKAAKGEKAENMYNSFIEKAISDDIKTETGIFGADMKVELVNDGPVTILLDSSKLF
ncbi:MAG: D-tyrosyl-tRNA(Tyr) deacylase [Tissierellia bacterium]|nr:D-tyrosyl-tRNA(Tyr) deacylase [Tissierellia bacterium]